MHPVRLLCTRQEDPSPDPGDMLAGPTLQMLVRCKVLIALTCAQLKKRGATFLEAMRLRMCFWIVTAAAERRALRAVRAACRLPSSVAFLKLRRVRCPRVAAWILTAAAFLCRAQPSSALGARCQGHMAAENPACSPTSSNYSPTHLPVHTCNPTHSQDVTDYTWKVRLQVCCRDSSLSDQGPQ